MEKQERGLLLVEQEEAEKNISDIRKNISSKAKSLIDIAQVILSNPEQVTFSNAPKGIGDIPLELMNVPSINWQTIPKFEEIGHLIQRLRNEKRRLIDINSRLNR